MELSLRYDGSHVSTSPNGELLACVTAGRLRIHHVQAPQRLLTDFPLKTTSKDISALKWSADSNSVAASSTNLVEVLSIDNSRHSVRIDNGSGGLGRLLSSDFIGDRSLLSLWEFGRAKVWNLFTGKGTELGDLKTTGDGPAWQLRPANDIPTIALLSRPAAEDTLAMHFAELSKSIPPVKLPTVDVQSMSWSPNGRWLAVLDTPTARPSVHFYTPDAHHFRSYPPASPHDTVAGLGVKAVTWSDDSRVVALSRYDGKIVLLNTTTFAPLAMIEHNTTIDQSSMASHQQAPIWREAVSASNERRYTLAAQPVSPPLSRTKPSTEPSELGVAEASFSADGSYLATRDERMLSTVWIWGMATLAAHAVVMQHNNVQSVRWHPTRPNILMLDCGEGIGYLYDVSSSSPPVPVNVLLPGTPTLSWVHTAADSKPAVLAATKSSFRMLCPEGRDSTLDDMNAATGEGAEMYEEGESEDSLLDVLSGRRPAPQRKPDQSYTEVSEGEAEAADEAETMRLEDTFRDKKVLGTAEIDPLDDSQIF